MLRNWIEIIITKLSDCTKATPTGMCDCMKEIKKETSQKVKEIIVCVASFFFFFFLYYEKLRKASTSFTTKCLVEE